MNLSPCTGVPILLGHPARETIEDPAHAKMSVPIVLVSLLNQIAPWILLNGTEFSSVFSEAQLAALTRGFLRLHGMGLLVAEAFWGLCLLPFGLLVIKSGYIPKALGYLLIVSCSAT